MAKSAGSQGDNYPATSQAGLREPLKSMISCGAIYEPKVKDEIGNCRIPISA